MTSELKKLLNDIRSWMIDRDHDRRDPKLFDRIDAALKPPSKKCPTCDGRGYYQEGGTMSQFIDCDCKGYK